MTKPFSVPLGDEDTWSDIATKEFDANARAHYALLQALNDDDIARVIHCKSAYESWFSTFEVWLSSNGWTEIESWFSKQHDSLALTEWLVTSGMVKGWRVLTIISIS